ASEPSNSTKILDRVVELETKLRKQEKSLKDLQGSMKSWKAQDRKPADCRLIFKAQPKDCELPRKPANRYQTTQKNDEDDCESFNDVVLTILRHPENIYHINIREMASGTVLGCLLANGRAINEAIALGLFEDIHTFCELDKHREHDPRDCPLGISPDILCPRELLGVPAGQAGRFFSLTNALKLAKQPSDQRLGCSELSMVSLHWRGSPGQSVRIGQGAVTGSHLLSMRSNHHFSITDFSEPGQTSSSWYRS
ncbi:hypothetical protein M5D96_003565, partial [Drosophila gunungcola]